MCSLFAGFAEGAAILVVVRVAVELASDKVSSDFVPFAAAPTSPMVALLIAAALAVLTLLAHLVIARESAMMSSSVLRNGRSRALRAFTAARWSTQATQRVGALQETVASLTPQASRLTQIYAVGVANLLMLSTFLVIAITVNPLGVGIIGVTGLAIFVAIRPITRRTRETGGDFVEANVEFAETAADFASSAMELRAFGVSDIARSELEGASADVAERQRSARLIAAFGTTLYRDVAVLLLIGSVGVLTMFDRGAVGSVSAVVVLVVRSLGSAHAVNAMIQTANERGANVGVMMDRIASLEASADDFGDVDLAPIDTIELRHVAYAYPGADLALQNVSFTLRRGEHVGIVGPSGSGKSTLMQLLLRLRTPVDGTVSVNGNDYLQYAPASWSARVAFVPQEPSLFEGTVADNIAFHRACQRDDILRAATRANVATEIEQLADGFDTVLGPGGTGLSGGQKQRIAIARALIGDPDLLVMDEPSSALDPRSERLLTETIADLGESTTVVIVAHRGTTLELCHRIIRIEDGTLVSDAPRVVAPSVDVSDPPAPDGERTPVHVAG